MGLDNLVNDKTPESKKSSSGSTSGSSSGSSRSRDNLPEVSFVRDDESGELTVHQYPNSIWHEQSFKDETVEMLIKTKDELRLLRDKIAKKAEENLTELLKNNPERALKLCKMVRGSMTGTGPSKTQTCAVCEDKINLFKDEYERIGNKVIHREHTVGDLANAGLVGDIEHSWDFVESQYKNRY